MFDVDDHAGTVVSTAHYKNHTVVMAKVGRAITQSDYVDSFKNALRHAPGRLSYQLLDIDLSNGLNLERTFEMAKLHKEFGIEKIYVAARVGETSDQHWEPHREILEQVHKRAGVEAEIQRFPSTRSGREWLCRLAEGSGAEDKPWFLVYHRGHRAIVDYSADRSTNARFTQMSSKAYEAIGVLGGSEDLFAYAPPSDLRWVPEDQIEAQIREGLEKSRGSQVKRLFIGVVLSNSQSEDDRIVNRSQRSRSVYEEFGIDITRKQFSDPQLALNWLWNVKLPTKS